MKIPTKKLANGFELPVYGLGLWGMGGFRETDTSRDAEDVAAIRAAIDAGVTHLDTAEMYGVGHAEELLGQALRAGGYDRKALLIATKVLGSNAAYGQVKAACAKSLDRMGLDYIDLYLLHWFPSPGVDIRDTMRAMDELVREGLVKNIGVCNFTPKRFDAAQAVTANKLVCNQVYYNVKMRAVEELGVLKHAQDHDVLLNAWRPLEKGALEHNDLMDDLAKKYNKSPAQMAINWLISQDHVVTMSKTSSSGHLEENLGAFGWKMEAEDVERLRDEYPSQDNSTEKSHLFAAGDIPAV